MRPRLLKALGYVAAFGLMYALCHQPPVLPAKPVRWEPPPMYAKAWPQVWDC